MVRNKFCLILEASKTRLASVWGEIDLFGHRNPNVKQLTQYCDAYKIKHESPKEKNRYFSSTAKLYISKVLSLEDSADTSIIKVDFGK